MDDNAEVMALDAIATDVLRTRVYPDRVSPGDGLPENVVCSKTG